MPRTIRQTAAFRRDVKREKKGAYRGIFDTELLSVIAALANDEPIPPRYLDHARTGNKKGLRACHLRPDLLLIYRLGSHSTLFGI